jgi:predicted DNA-binding helix-hairpin-helix protein
MHKLSIGVLGGVLGVLVTGPAYAAHVTDRGEIAIDVAAPGTTVCHYGELGPIDGTSCTPEERLTFSNLKRLEPNAFAALVVHYGTWQASITFTRTTALHSMTDAHISEDLAAYAQGMRDRMVGTQMQISEAPHLVRASNNVQVIVSAIRNPSAGIVTRTLEIRALHATYRVLFSAAEGHAADAATLADRSVRTLVARPALTYGEEAALNVPH